MFYFGGFCQRLKKKIQEVCVCVCEYQEIIDRERETENQRDRERPYWIVE